MRIIIAHAGSKPAVAATVVAGVTAVAVVTHRQCQGQRRRPPAGEDWNRCILGRP